MRQAVIEHLYDFNRRFESDIPFLYQDNRGLVSAGVGILADPIGLCMSLPLKRPDGSLATPGEIRDEWQKVKRLGYGDYLGGPPANPAELPMWRKGVPNPAAKYGHLYAKPYTTLRLDTAGLHFTLEAKAAIFDRQLAERFPSWPEWNSDAQLAIMSLTWACGAAFNFPKLDAALRRLDFLAASAEVKIDDSKNAGVTPRNAANRTLLRNASFIEANDLDADVLYFPQDLMPEIPDAA